MSTRQSPTATVDLVLLLAQASHALTTELTAGLEALGITPRVHCVLSKAMAGELSQIQLAELCGLDKTTMVVTIDELETAGLATRRPSAADRRARIISVTDAGAAKVAEAGAVVDRVYADVLASLPAADRAVFVGALSHLVEGRLSTPVKCDRTVRRTR
ncbi:MAG: MarR family transcriptional regulator, transcriptional regulator for hemolysin [Actinomycetota bacterium]|jgi:DNA-binding MarR family transcriptional regulator|nr:MarR family transcriptional regulator, transcriptional regulator for hemolysin [Actinomycetota bacterium]